MDERIKEKLINRAKTNPYVNFLGIDFTVIEEGRVEAHMPLHDEQRQYSGVTHGGVLAALADTIAGFAAPFRVVRSYRSSDWNHSKLPRRINSRESFAALRV